VKTDTHELPEYIANELPNLPRHGDRKTLALIITKFIFPVSRRTLEVWPLKWRRVNGHAVAATDEALVHAWRKFQSAPAMLSGRGRRRTTGHDGSSLANVDRETAA
jgi:hypothetical protein